MPSLSALVDLSCVPRNLFSEVGKQAVAFEFSHASLWCTWASLRRHLLKKRKSHREWESSELLRLLQATTKYLRGSHWFSVMCIHTSRSTNHISSAAEQGVIVRNWKSVGFPKVLSLLSAESVIHTPKAQCLTEARLKALCTRLIMRCAMQDTVTRLEKLATNVVAAD